MVCCGRCGVVPNVTPKRCSLYAFMYVTSKRNVDVKYKNPLITVYQCIVGGPNHTVLIHFAVHILKRARKTAKSHCIFISILRKRLGVGSHLAVGVLTFSYSIHPSNLSTLPATRPRCRAAASSFSSSSASTVCTGSASTFASFLRLPFTKAV